MELRESRNLSSKALESQLQQTEDRLRRLLGSNLDAIQNESYQSLQQHGRDIKAQFKIYHTQISVNIQHYIKNGCSSLATSLREDRELLRRETKDCLDVINSLLGDNIISELGSTTSSLLPIDRNPEKTQIGAENVEDSPSRENLASRREERSTEKSVLEDIQRRTDDAVSNECGSGMGFRSAPRRATNPIVGSMAPGPALSASRRDPYPPHPVTTSLPPPTVRDTAGAPAPIDQDSSNVAPRTSQRARMASEPMGAAGNLHSPLNSSEHGDVSVANNTTNTSNLQLFPRATFNSQTSFDAASLHLLKEKLMQKPSAPYNGEPHLFQLFVNQFKTRLKNIPLDPWEMICILEAHTTGRVQKIVRSYMINGSANPTEAMENIERELFDKFGDGAEIARSILAKIDSFPVVKSAHQIEKLDDLLEICKLIKSNLPYLQELSQFNSSIGISRIWAKLPESFQNSWRTVCQNHKTNLGGYPKFEYFIRFLDNKVKEYSDPNHRKIPVPDAAPKPRDLRTYKSDSTSAWSKTAEMLGCCVLHPTGKHDLKSCRLFLKKTNAEKVKTMREHGLCFRCLGQHMRSNCQENPKCDKCDKPHLTILHRDGSQGILRPAHASQPAEDRRDTDAKVSSLCTQVCGDAELSLSCSKTLLADITLPGRSSKSIRCYVIVDDQSGSSFADPKLASYFEVESPTVDYTLTTLAGYKVAANGILMKGLRIRGVGEKRGFSLPPVLTNEYLPENKDEVASPSIVMKHRHIAHYAKFFNKIDHAASTLLLLGRDCDEAMFSRSYGHKGPYPVRTRLGWSLVGKICLNQSAHQQALRTQIALEHFEKRLTFPDHSANSEKKLSNDIFMESPDDEQPMLSRDDQRFLSIVKKGIHVDEEGHITLPLPFRIDDVKFPDNRQAVLIRETNTLNRLKKDSQKLGKCLRAMQSNIRDKHVEVVPEHELVPMTGHVWYIPVFPVTHQKKGKVRLVFDSSAKYQGTSLNDKLLTGPDFYNKLSDVLIKFRLGEFAFSADIANMFHCFHLEEKDRDKTRFFWFRHNDPTQDLVEYRGRVQLFGNTSSPALAITGLRYAVNNEDVQTSDQVKKFVEENFYVDDALQSTDTPEQAIQILTEAREALQRYHIRLHKLCSNSQIILDAFPKSEHGDASEHALSEPITHQTLGLKWDVHKDAYIVETRVPQCPFTKRGVLSTINSIFDPLNFISPVILTGKLLQRRFLQDKSLDSHGWDDELPPSHREQWETWKNSLSSADGLTIARCVRPARFGKITDVQLHVFADASLQATGHVMYLRSTNDIGQRHVALVNAKSRITPRMANTIPRLELCAALEASLAAKATMKTHGMTEDKVFLYSDSTVVLGYLNNTNRNFSGYVTRRTNLILKQFPTQNWKYVETKLNPADIASRTHSLESLKATCWFDGPEFLWNDTELQTEFPLISHDDLPEATIDSKVLLASHDKPLKIGLAIIAQRASDLTKAINVCKIATSFALHLLDNRKRRHGQVIALRDKPSSEEAMKILIRLAQNSEFPEVFDHLRKRNCLPETHPIAELSPFVDSENLLRVGGRLHHSEIPFDQKHPLILPQKHPLTVLILKKYHEKVKHQGRVLTMGAVRAAGFFVQKGSALVKSFVKNCVICKKLRGPYLSQIMSDLPPDRLEQIAPFFNCGVDVFGPYTIVDGTNTRRSAAAKKLWGLLFTCLVSRAVHIEPLPSVDITAFKNAFRRFTCLRGPCKLLRSDRGTNFIGAFNQDNEKSRTYLDEELKQLNVQWIFNPPKASHFGGVFERKIGSVKRIIDACLLQLGPRHLTRDELHTFFAEATAIINNTPLTQLSTDPNDPLPLTPAKLLFNREDPCPEPRHDFTEADLLSYGSRRWRRVQYLASQFYGRWRSEYLQTLTSRRKWTRPRPSLKPGDIVLLRDRTQKRNHWPVAKVERVKISSDGRVRSAVLSVPRNCGELERPISELVLLVSVN